MLSFLTQTSRTSLHLRVTSPGSVSSILCVFVVLAARINVRCSPVGVLVVEKSLAPHNSRSFRRSLLQIEHVTGEGSATLCPGSALQQGASPKDVSTTPAESTARPHKSTDVSLLTLLAPITDGTRCIQENTLHLLTLSPRLTRHSRTCTSWRRNEMLFTKRTRA